MSSNTVRMSEENDMQNIEFVIVKLKRQRASKKGYVTRRINLINDTIAKNESRSKVKYLLSSLLDYFDSVKKIHEEILNLTSHHGIEGLITEEEWMEEENLRIELCKSDVQGYLDSRANDPSSSGSDFTASWLQRHVPSMISHGSEEVDRGRIQSTQSDDLLLGATAADFARMSFVPDDQEDVRISGRDDGGHVISNTTYAPPPANFSMENGSRITPRVPPERLTRGSDIAAGRKLPQPGVKLRPRQMQSVAEAPSDYLRTFQSAHMSWDYGGANVLRPAQLNLQEWTPMVQNVRPRMQSHSVPDTTVTPAPVNADQNVRSRMQSPSDPEIPAASVPMFPAPARTGLQYLDGYRSNSSVSSDQVIQRNEQFFRPRIPPSLQEVRRPQRSDPGQVSRSATFTLQRVAPTRLQYFSPDAYVSPNPSGNRSYRNDIHAPMTRDNQSVIDMYPRDPRCADFPMFDRHDDNISQAATTVHPTCGNDVDGWIDELDVSRVNTPHPITSGITPDVTMAWLVQQSLPRVQIPDFDGSPTLWVEFVSKFKDMVHDPAYLTDSQRKTYLLQHVKGKAKRAVQGFANDSRGYVLALKRLKYMFGQKSVIAKATLTKITQGKQLESDDRAGLEEFYYSISDCLVTLRQLNYASDVYSSDTLRLAAKRLPTRLHYKWGEYCLFIRKRNAEPSLIDLEDWLQARVMAQKDLPEKHTQKKSHENNDKDNKPNKMFSATITTSQQKLSCLKCGDRHPVWRCKEYKKLSPQSRFQLLMGKRLCYNCMKDGHVSTNCTSKNACLAPECKQKHHTSLHEYFAKKPGYTAAVADDKGEGKDVKEKDPEPKIEGDKDVENAEVKHNGMLRSYPKDVYLQVVPVKLSNGDKAVATYGLLDSCSETTFIRQDIADALNLQGELSDLHLGTVKDDAEPLKVPKVSFLISSVEEDASFPVEEAYVLPVDRFNMPARPCPPNLSDLYTHLDGIEIASVAADEITVLIGGDVPRAHIQAEVRQGSDNELLAFKTPFGWTIFGTAPASDQVRRQSYQSCCTRTKDSLHSIVEKLWVPEKKVFCNILQRDPLEQALIKFWEEDNTGILPARDIAMSRDDKRALKILEKQTIFDGEKYITPMLWDDPACTFPDNSSMAKKRYDLLCRRLRADDKLYEDYKAKMHHYFEKGFARKMSKKEAQRKTSKTWILPTHPVFHPKKPNKLRVVNDAAAKFQGTSLNTNLITGPDLLNSLVGIILRFRIGKIAVTADLEEFFHQVRVPAADADSLRFLWKDDIWSDRPPDVMQMLVHIFGAKDSVTCAIHALHQTARDHQEDFDPLTFWTILKSFYVDDLLQSYPSVDSALPMVHELFACTKRGGFRLTKWMSNSKEIIDSLPPSEVSSKMTFELDAGTVEKALGMLWNIADDNITYCTNFKDVPKTKRGMLKVTSSVFDPPGFVAAFILFAKLLIQEAWKTGCDWDSEVSFDILEKWTLWLSNANSLSLIKIPRCYYYGASTITEKQLHIFCDASELAYGCVGYLRVSFKEGGHHVVLVMSKSRLAPIKTITVPRLELNGALIAARLYQFLIHELDLAITKAWFWTDSTLVLQYLYNTKHRFKIYTANRVTEILDITDSENFRHVPGKLNPADMLSRGVSHPAKLLEMDENGTSWFDATKFLHDDEENWPVAQIDHLDDNDVEIKKKSVLVAVGLVKRKQDRKPIDYQRFSTWLRLLRVVAWILRFITNCRIKGIAKLKRRLSGEVVTPVEIITARLFIVKDVQTVEFQDVISKLRLNQSLPKRHQLLPLSPFLDDCGALRVGGRLEYASMPEVSKHQLILPKKHHVTQMIIFHEHTNNGHIGTEHVLANLRQLYWIINGRTAIKAAIRRCFYCQVKRAQVLYPFMANIPQGRMACDKPPFNNTGVDLFGHVFVKQGRKRLKRWIVLYTCLTVRCVHLEVVEGADTDSFIMSLKRFVNRRGSPEVFYSDCGTNFKGATNELKQVITELDHKRIAEFTSSRNILWSFNPPAAPHMGGVWERLVRSVKEVMTGMMHEKVLTDPQLATLMTEVESVINSRPLTHVSEDINDLDAVTPNHLLLGQHRIWNHFCDIAESDVLSRRRWKQVQALKLIFWNRWRREYLPSLTKRTCWNQNITNYKVDELVVLKEDDLKRVKWPLARIVKVLPAKDGVVRTVEVRTKDGVYVRPVTKLLKLEESEVPQGEGNVTNK